MILLCGQLAESPLAMVGARLHDAGVPFVALDQQYLEDVSVDYQIDGEAVTGRLRVLDSSYALELSLECIFAWRMPSSHQPRGDATYRPIIGTTWDTCTTRSLRGAK
jgi:hypothetical protein